MIVLPFDEQQPAPRDKPHRVVVKVENDGLSDAFVTMRRGMVVWAKAHGYDFTHGPCMHTTHEHYTETECHFFFADVVAAVHFKLRWCG